MDNNNIKLNAFKSVEYSSSDIHEAVGSEKHRLYVSQFLGASDVIGITNQLFEIIDNSLDESIEYRNRLLNIVYENSQVILGYYPEMASMSWKDIVPPRKIAINISEQDIVTVIDEGRGLPCTPHKVTGEPTVYRIFESDSAGGKGNHAKGGYTSGTAGQHGAGASVSKSCTEYFNIETTTMGELDVNNNIIGRGTYALGYERGERKFNLTCINENLETTGNKFLDFCGIYKTGTKIVYKYDTELFTATYKGLPSEPYRNDLIVNRLKNIMLAISDKDSIIIEYKYKNEPVEVISPYTNSPDKYLKVKDYNNYINVVFSSNHERSHPDYFDCNLHIYRDFDNFIYDIKTIVNRLSLESSTSNSYIQNAIRDIIKTGMQHKIKTELTDIQKNFYDRSMLRTETDSQMSRFRVMAVMNLTTAEFDGQTKSNLKSTKYISEFNYNLQVALNAYQNYFDKFIDEGFSNIKSSINTRKLMMKQEEVQRKRAEKNREATLIINTAKAAKTELERMKQMADMRLDSKSRFSFKASEFNIQDSYLALVEGPSAATALGEINDLPISVACLSGKPKNVIKSDDLSYKQLEYIITLLNYDFKGVFILTDADSDALHIRTLLIAIILEYAKKYFKKEEVWIINNPNAKIRNDTFSDIDIEIDGKKIRYPSRRIAYTKTPIETYLAVRAGMTPLVKYSGLADSVTDESGDITLRGLILDPDYRCKVPMPSQEEASNLIDMLSESSMVKKQYANTFCTEKLKFVKRLGNRLENTRVNPLDFNASYYTTVPVVKDWMEHSLDYLNSSVSSQNQP